MANKKVPKERKPPVAAEDFIRAYQGSDSIAEVAVKIGLDASSVSTRAADYRKRGIRLKQFPRKYAPRKPLDVNALNALIGSLAAPNGDTNHE